MNENRESIDLAVSRRDFFRLAGLAGGAVVLAACGAPATPAPTEEPVEEPVEEPTEEPAAPEEVTISWWNQFSTPTCLETFPLVVTGFEEEYPGITVEYEISGGPLARISGERAPRPRCGS